MTDEVKKNEPMNVKIDFDVPIPEVPRGHRARKYPLDKLEVKASAFFPDVDHQSILSAVNRFKKTQEGKGREFTTRRTTEKGVEGVRVWRTK